MILHSSQVHCDWVSGFSLKRHAATHLIRARFTGRGISFSGICGPRSTLGVTCGEMVDPLRFTTDIPFALPPPFGAARFIAGGMLPLLLNDGSLPVLPFLEEFTCVTYIDLKSSLARVDIHDVRLTCTAFPSTCNDHTVPNSATIPPRLPSTHLFRHRLPHALDLPRPARITRHILPPRRQLTRIPILCKLLRRPGLQRLIFRRSHILQIDVAHW
jgi:hypothetical protein